MQPHFAHVFVNGIQLEKRVEVCNKKNRERAERNGTEQSRTKKNGIYAK